MKEEQLQLSGVTINLPSFLFPAVHSEAEGAKVQSAIYDLCWTISKEQLPWEVAWVVAKKKNNENNTKTYKHNDGDLMKVTAINEYSQF